MLVLLLAGCAGTPGTTAAGGAGAAGPGDRQGAGAAALPSAHVHGVGVNPGDGLVYLATHDGLFRYEHEGVGQVEAVRVGEVNDLMGFTIAGPDHFYASGHPGPDSDLPNPVGLMESTDAGRTWTPLSRQGRSDFHALTASEAAILGFDGTLRASPDGRTWTEVAIPAPPYSLAVSADGSTLLATTEEGPLRSRDGGGSWQPLPDAPLLMLVDWAAGDIVTGVTPQGEVAVSSDAGASWELRGSIGGQPQALGAAGDGNALHLLAVVAGTLLSSTDGGRSFEVAGTD